jgi:hypothetical protein
MHSLGLGVTVSDVRGPGWKKISGALGGIHIILLLNYENKVCGNRLKHEVTRCRPRCALVMPVETHWKMEWHKAIRKEHLIDWSHKSDQCSMLFDNHTVMRVTLLFETCFSQAIAKWHFSDHWRSCMLVIGRRASDMSCTDAINWGLYESNNVVWKEKISVKASTETSCSALHRQMDAVDYYCLWLRACYKSISSNNCSA